MSSLWDRFQQYFLRHEALGFTLDISRMKFAEPHMESLPPVRARDLVDYSPLLEGARYVRNRGRLLAAVFVKAGLGVTGASWVIFPIMGRSVFPITGHGIGHERAALLGMSALMGARGLGALLGPLVAAPWALNFADGDGGLAAFYVAAGIAVLAVSLITNYQYSPKREWTPSTATGSAKTA